MDTSDSKSKSKYNTTYIQAGGKGTETDRVFTFEAPAEGTLTVVSSNTGSSAATDRFVTVKVGDGEPESKVGGASSNEPVTLSFDIAAGAVKIYPTGNALRFYKIEYHSK